MVFSTQAAQVIMTSVVVRIMDVHKLSFTHKFVKHTYPLLPNFFN